MALFSNFCNICYKVDNASLKDISEENMKHLSDTLITFVGHADIIKHNSIYLCQLCCEELTRFDKFRDMCFSNLIQLRQRYINMELELQDNDACAVQNTLQQFVNEEVLRKSSLEKSNCPVSISTDYHEIIKSLGNVNNDCLVFNSQVTNLQLETNECKFVGACSDVSGINSVTECDESRVAITNEENMKNEMLRRSENTKLEKFEVQANEDFKVSDTNIDNESDSFEMVFIKEEFDLKNERESSYSENLTLTNFENESNEHANLDVKMPVVNNSRENVNSGKESTKEELHMKQETRMESMKLETTECEFGDAENVHFEFANVCTIMNMEDGKKYISSVEDKAGMKLSTTGRNNKLTPATSDAQPDRPHVREFHNGISKALQSGAHDQVYPSVEAHICAVCNKSFRTRSYLTRHARTHTDKKPFKCSVCNKTFTQSNYLTGHERIHSDERPYKCTVCNKKFRHLATLTAHERIHSGDRPYKCTVCNKTFTHMRTLTTHARLHNGDRPYKCTVCNKTFTQLGHLTTHARIHSGDKPYQCTVCNKMFTQFGSLTTHVRIHSGDKPYKCTVCNKTFTQMSHLTSHARIHSDDKP